MNDYYFISFGSTNNALQAESYLKKRNYDIVVMPTPREVTQSCGLSIKFDGNVVDDITSFTAMGEIKAKGIYHIKKENGTRKISKIG